MKRLSTAILILSTVVFFSFASAPASAHVLKTDGAIGAILHINPDDNPRTGSSTSYIIYFDDISGRFMLPKCNCSVAIQEDGKTIYTGPLVATSSQVSNDTYTFTKPDVYTLQVNGQPKEPNAFQPFTLRYLVRVTSGTGLGDIQPFPVLLWVGMAMSIALILLGAYRSEHGVE